MSNINDPSPKGDKKTVIAVILSVVVITAGFMIQGALFPPTTRTTQAAQTTSSVGQTPVPNAMPSAPASAIKAAEVATNLPGGSGTSSAFTTVTAPIAERLYTISTDIFEAVLSNKGGDIVSLKLKKHKDKDGFVDLIVSGDKGAQGLSVAFGPVGSAPLGELMNARVIDEKTIEFSRVYTAAIPGEKEAVPFVYKKAYTFRNGEYLFGLAITLENSVNKVLPLDQAGAAYTVTLGPQIGPSMAGLSKNSRADFRKFITYSGGKKHEERPKAGVTYNPKEQPTWVALSGKYFSFIAVPEYSGFLASLLVEPDESLGQKNQVSLTRPAIRSSVQTDSYYFYYGPKTNAELSKYDYPDRNAFQRSGYKLESAMDSSGMLTWLETGLKFMLNLFYGLIPNYGIAIILVTILTKLLLFPITKKGSMSQARMQELQPEIQAIQAKYKDNPQKMNQEMAEFYKRVGYNPMSGCLPLLVQFPIFIAMYNLFNTHFDLRGALFIPGWIPDLSQPEAIFSFPTINLVIWKLSAIRALPILYLLSQLFYGKFAQTTTAGSGQSAGQMKFMMYGMPIMFFFILYDVPSGLLIYWIFSNVIQIGQQVVINNMLKKHKGTLAAAGASSSSSSVIKGGAAKSSKIVPNKGKKR
jgi:YidC/Oxa1 family membrane protein insertase